MIEWKRVQGFTEHENWGDPDRMDPELIEGLVQLRKYVNRSIVIHCGFGANGHVAGSLHGEGKAVDLHISGLHVMDQFLAASRFAAFRGIGCYPLWDHPGLHLDTRPVSFRALWWRDVGGSYQEITNQSIRSWK